MKMINGKSASANVAEAVKGVTSPKLLIFTCDADHFDASVAEIEKLYPSVPSIGCVGMAYDSAMLEKGIAVTAFTEGVKVKTGVLESVSTMPARYVHRL